MNYPEKNAPQQYYKDDEIDLFDLFKILWKNKLMIIILPVLMTTAAAAYGFYSPKIYEVSAIFEPGRKGGGDLLKSPRNIKTNIVEGVYYKDLKEKNDIEIDEFPDINVNVYEGSNSIKLLVESSEPEFAVKVLSKLIAIIQNSLQEDLKQETQGIVREIDKEKVTIEVLTKKIEQTQKQIAQVQSRIKGLEANIGEVSTILQNEAKDFLFYLNEIQMSQDFLNELEEKLTEHEIKKTESTFQQEYLNNILNNLKPIYVLISPTISNEPVKPRISLIIALSFVVGLMLSIMIAFLIEGIRNRFKEEKKIT